MPTHDPRMAMENLRDHLALHDKPIAFFLGAGASYAVTRIPPGEKDPRKAEHLIPAVKGLTEMCANAVEALGDSYINAWSLFVKECKAHGEDPNIENILSRVYLKFTAIGEGDQLAGLDKTALRKVEKTIRNSIAKAVQPMEEDIPLDLPHADLARWIARTSRRDPIEIFTVNYDILIERSLEGEHIPVFDGFVGSYRPFFDPKSLFREQAAPGVSWVRVWKIHGSVNWSLEDCGGRPRVVRGMPDISGEMILPSYRKYDESRKQPYVALLDRLSRFLDRDDSFMVAIGYSFGDQHINNIIFDVLENKPRAHVFSLQFEELDDSHHLIERAKRCPNLSVLGPETGVIRGTRGMWRLTDPVDDRVADLVDVGFDSDAIPPDKDELSHTGRLLLGDFGYFCKFLISMTPEQESR